MFDRQLRSKDSIDRRWKSGFGVLEGIRPSRNEAHTRTVPKFQGRWNSRLSKGWPRKAEFWRVCGCARRAAPRRLFDAECPTMAAMFFHWAVATSLHSFYSVKSSLSSQQLTLTVNLCKHLMVMQHFIIRRWTAALSVKSEWRPSFNA